MTDDALRERVIKLEAVTDHQQTDIDKLTDEVDKAITAMRRTLIGVLASLLTGAILAIVSLLVALSATTPG